MVIYGTYIFSFFKMIMRLWEMNNTSKCGLSVGLFGIRGQANWDESNDISDFPNISQETQVYLTLYLLSP